MRHSTKRKLYELVNKAQVFKSETFANVGIF